MISSLLNGIVPALDDPQTAAVVGLGLVIVTYLAWFVLFRRDGLGYALFIPTGAVIIALGLLGWWPPWAIVALLLFVAFAVVFLSGAFGGSSQ
jgi:hypothetical protein